MKSNSATIHFVDFDVLQELAISSSRFLSDIDPSNESDVQIFVYALTTSNFSRVLKMIASTASEARHVVVSTVSNLAYLGLSDEHFPREVSLLTLAEFTDVIQDLNSDSLYEEFLTQRSTRIEFFEQSTLTTPQLQLLIHISQGFTNAEISKLMFLTEKGVESAIKRLSLKLDCEYSIEKPLNLRIILGRRYAQMLGVLTE